MDKKKAEDKFTGRAEVYSKGRPGYSEEFVDCLFEKYGFSEASSVADVGSGTGKFAKYLLVRGCRCFCVEINDDMRSQADKVLSDFPLYYSVKGSAENTNLPDSSVDFITVAQAFHWFDVNAFKTESLRILKPGGRAFLIWNAKNPEALLNKRLYKVFSEFCPDFKGFSGGIKPHDERIRDYFCNRYEFLSFDNPLRLDRAKFISRSLSASYSLKNGDVRFDEYMTELNNVFDEFHMDGVITLENETVVYTGIPAVY